MLSARVLLWARAAVALCSCAAVGESCCAFVLFACAAARSALVFDSFVRLLLLWCAMFFLCLTLRFSLVAKFIHFDHILRPLDVSVLLRLGGWSWLATKDEHGGLGESRGLRSAATGGEGVQGCHSRAA